MVQIHLRVPGVLLNSKTKGDITELKILTKLIEHGYTVLIPYGDNCRYDLVFEQDGVFYRVQCKTASLVNNGDVLVFNTRSHHPRDYNKVKTYENDVDYFGVYNSKIGKCWLVPIEFVNSTAQTLRLNSTKNNQIKGILWAHKFEI